MTRGLGYAMQHPPQRDQQSPEKTFSSSFKVFALLFFTIKFRLYFSSIYVAVIMKIIKILATSANLLIWFDILVLALKPARSASHEFGKFI